MKMRFAALLAAVGLVLVLGGCNGDKPQHFSEEPVAGMQGMTSLDFPVIDGSSSTVNMHSTIRAFLTDDRLGVVHSQTYAALERLIPGSNRPADMVLAVKYHDETLKEAQQRGADLVITPVAKEGVVFVVHPDNPVDSLTPEQLRGIYSGEITNWSEVGGRNEKIKPFTRNEDSGSQTAMLNFMDGVEMVEGSEDYTINAMGALLSAVGDSEGRGIGYNIFSWSAERMVGVKFLQVDGVAPGNDTIADDSYPLIVHTYSYYNRGNEAAEKLTDWLVGEQGQRIVALAGYVGVNGELPPERDWTLPNVNDMYNSNQAIEKHFIDNYLVGRWKDGANRSIRFPGDDNEYRYGSPVFTISGVIGREMFLQLIGDVGKAEDVTIAQRVNVWRVSTGEELHRYIVLTRKRGSTKFSVIAEGWESDIPGLSELMREIYY